MGQVLHVQEAVKAQVGIGLIPGVEGPVVGVDGQGVVAQLLADGHIGGDLLIHKPVGGGHVGQIVGGQSGEHPELRADGAPAGGGGVEGPAVAVGPFQQRVVVLQGILGELHAGENPGVKKALAQNHNDVKLFLAGGGDRLVEVQQRLHVLLGVALRGLNAHGEHIQRKAPHKAVGIVIGALEGGVVGRHIEPSQHIFGALPVGAEAPDQHRHQGCRRQPVKPAPGQVRPGQSQEDNPENKGRQPQPEPLGQRAADEGGQLPGAARHHHVLGIKVVPVDGHLGVVDVGEQEGKPPHNAGRQSAPAAQSPEKQKDQINNHNLKAEGAGLELPMEAQPGQTAVIHVVQHQQAEQGKHRQTEIPQSSEGTGAED